MISKHLTMVTREDDDRVVTLPGLLQRFQDPCKLVINLVDHGVVKCLATPGIVSFRLQCFSLEIDGLQRLLGHQVRRQEMGTWHCRRVKTVGIGTGRNKGGMGIIDIHRQQPGTFFSCPDKLHCPLACPGRLVEFGRHPVLVIPERIQVSSLLLDPVSIIVPFLPVIAWCMAIERTQGPTCLLLSRQDLPYQERTAEQRAAIARGGYVLRDCRGTPEAIIIATGSEVALAVEVADVLKGQDRRVRVVSMPSADLFDDQDESYRESVLPSSVSARVAIEAGTSQGWSRYVGTQGCVIGLDSFGESAPADAVFDHFGFTVAHVVPTVESVIERSKLL